MPDKGINLLGLQINNALVYTVIKNLNERIYDDCNQWYTYNWLINEISLIHI